MILILINLVTACASNPNPDERPLPQTGKTMTQIYQEQMLKGQNTSEIPLSDINQRAVITDRHSTSLTSNNALNVTFKRVPNPSLTLFVYPHLKSDMPIPGYSTGLSLYEKNHYALPGETQ
jgi:conjugative transfer region lipoprotein (TIGR03751 family)